MTLSLDQIVRVTAEIELAAGPAQNFDRSIFVYPGELSIARADLGNRARDLRVNVYPNLAAVAEDYAATHEAFNAAQVYFAQVPMPREFLTAGWFEAGAQSFLFGATRSTATQLTTIKGLGDTTITVAGQSVSLALGVTGTGATGYGEVATVLQTAIRGVSGLSGVTVEYTDSAFVVTAPAGVDLGGPFSSPTATALGLDDGAGYFAGTVTETIAEGLARIRRANAAWYWLTLAESIHNDDDVIAAAQWAMGAGGVQGIIGNSESGVLVANESTSRAARISALKSDRSPIVWSRTADYKAAAVAGSMSSINLDAPNSLRTAKFLTLTGTTPDTITATQKAELDRKRVNHYSPFGPTPTFAEGWTPGGWIESRLWLDWLIARVQTDVFNLLRTTRRVGLTPQGQSLIQDTIESACEAGRRNGGLATRAVLEATAADIRQTTGAGFSGVLQRGYKVYAPPISTLTQTERDQRRMTPFRVWLAYTSFTHSIDIALTFNA